MRSSLGLDGTTPLTTISRGNGLNLDPQEPIAPASWPDLETLPDPEPEAPSLPSEMLPEPFKAWVTDAAERAQVPPEMIVVPALVATGSLIGRTMGIHPKQRDDWRVVPNLWGAVVGRPGILKSPAINEGLRPLRSLAQKAANQFKEQAGAAETSKVILQAQIAAAKADAQAAAKARNEADMENARHALQSLMGQLEGAEEHERRYTTNDVTVEALGEILRHNPRGVLLFRDELIGLLKSWEKPGREADRSFFLECWNGDGSFSFDRIGRGTVHVPSTTVSIIGGMTPGKLVRYASDATEGGTGDDGLLQRFQLLVWPETPKDWRNVDRYPDTVAYDRVVRLFELIDELDPLALGADDGHIPALRFAPDAQELFDAWRDELEKRLRGNDGSTPGFDSHLAKFRSLLPSLALIFHLLTVLDHGEPGPVTVKAAKLAASWCEFLECHARKVYAAELCGGEISAGHLAQRIRKGAVSDGATVREIYRNGWSGLSTPEPVWSAIDILENHGWVRVESTGRGGQRTDTLRINPKLRAET